MWGNKVHALCLFASGLVASLPACGDAAERDGHGLVRGRVTDVAGLPLESLVVVAAEARAHTNAEGRFELEVEAGREVRIAVESDSFSGAELPVRVDEGGAAQVEIAVKPRSSLKLANAAQGGRLEARDGFALELPADALRDASGKVAQGEIEVRYALIKDPAEVTAAPGRMEDDEKAGLDGYGMAEVRFYKGDQRLQLIKEMQVELPLSGEHGLAEGEDVALYALGEGDLRWKTGQAPGQVRADKAIIRTSQDAWIGAARKTPALGCVKGRLTLPQGKAQVANTTVRAARARGLSLVQAETAEDGSFCLPVSPDDDWSVSTFHDDGSESYAADVAVRSSDAAGMCGGDGCKDVGELALEKTAL